jgi:IPT/TIG domain
MRMVRRVALIMIMCASMVTFSVAAAPSITSLSPTSGTVNTSVTISGSGFGRSQGSSTVNFNGTTASVTSWSTGQIVATVPSGATSGNVVVTVSGVASNGVAFIVLPTPTITSLSPTSGAPGTSVAITGTNFGASQGSNSNVYFNGVLASVISWGDTSIVATVPTGNTTGNVQVYVSGVWSNGVAFTGAPSITSLSPASGIVGTTVYINGGNFGSSQGSSTVTFNGTVAIPTSWSATSIGATVPSGATSGYVVVTVSGVASSGVGFTVYPTPSSTTFHLHLEPGSYPGTDLLSTANPDAAYTSVKSADLYGLSNVTGIETFTTQSTTPGTVIPAGTVINFSLWMDETAAVSGLYPEAELAYLGNSGYVLNITAVPISRDWDAGVRKTGAFSVSRDGLRVEVGVSAVQVA